MKNSFNNSKIADKLSPWMIIAYLIGLSIILVLVSLLKIYIINYLAKKYYTGSEKIHKEGIFNMNNTKNIFFSIIDIILFTFIISII